MRVDESRHDVLAVGVDRFTTFVVPESGDPAQPGIRQREQQEQGRDGGDAKQVAAPVGAAAVGKSVVHDPGGQQRQRRAVRADGGVDLERDRERRPAGAPREEDPDRRRRAEPALQVGREDPDGDERGERDARVVLDEAGRQKAPPLLPDRALDRTEVVK